MRYVKCLAAVVAALAVVPAFAAVVTLEASFAKNADGWVGLPGVAVVYQATEGPSGGGYLKVTDIGTNNRGGLVVPDKFVNELKAKGDNGEYLAYGGMFEMDYQVITLGKSSSVGAMYSLTVVLVTSGGTYRYDQGMQVQKAWEGAGWNPIDFVVPLTEEGWKDSKGNALSKEDFEKALGSLTEIRIETEACFNSGKTDYDIVGFGGFRYYSGPSVKGNPDLPEPATLSLLGIGALALWRRRK